MISKEKVRNQVKSRFYYLFWGIATFSVVAGQVYVGSGYRMFARSLNRIFDTVQVQISEDYYRERYYYMSLEDCFFMSLIFLEEFIKRTLIGVYYIWQKFDYWNFNRKLPK